MKKQPDFLLVCVFYRVLSESDYLMVIPCITLILSKIGKSLLNFPLLIFVIYLDSLCDSLGARTQDPILKRDVLYLLS